jgi:Trm5-related predicted tRNA methylase
MRHIYYYGMLKGSARNQKTELKRMSEEANPINRLEELDTALVEVKARINELNHASILTTRDLEVSESAIDRVRSKVDARMRYFREVSQKRASADERRAVKAAIDQMSTEELAAIRAQIRGKSDE